MQEFDDVEAIGPILIGMKKLPHILQLGCSVREIVNMVTIAVLDAQTKRETITHIKGKKLIEKNPSFVIIDCNGVGYLLRISLQTFSKLADDEQCMLFSHLAIKEDSHTLYGFFDKNERDLFRQLISVSGVGPNTAQMILSSRTPQEIQQSILTENVIVLKGVKGIGAKTAQRIILSDLKR